MGSDSASEKPCLNEAHPAAVAAEMADANSSRIGFFIVMRI
jgi:hypothetical protein